MALSVAGRRHIYEPIGRRVRHRIAQEEDWPRHQHQDQDEGARTPMVLVSLLLVRATHRYGRRMDQLVQASVAGVVVEVAAPPDAVMPVSDGREK